MSRDDCSKSSTEETLQGCHYAGADAEIRENVSIHGDLRFSHSKRFLCNLK